MEELLVLTKKRKQSIKQLGYKYRQIWEHNFMGQLKSNERLKTFMDQQDIVERLDPRDAFQVYVISFFHISCIIYKKNLKALHRKV